MYAALVVKRNMTPTTAIMRPYCSKILRPMCENIIYNNAIYTIKNLDKAIYNIILISKTREVVGWSVENLSEYIFRYG